MHEKHTDQLFNALLTSLYYKFFLVSFPTNFLLPKETSIMQSPLRFSSCRGVAFEIKPHADPFAIERPAAPEPAQSGSSKGLQFWPWLGSSKVFPSSLQPSLSRPSSHFCDPDPDEDDEEDEEDEEPADEEVKHSEETEEEKTSEETEEGRSEEAVSEETEESEDLEEQSAEDDETPVGDDEKKDEKA